MISDVDVKIVNMHASICSATMSFAYNIVFVLS